MRKVKLNEVCEINPTKSEIKAVSDDTVISFIPMTDVSDLSQKIEHQSDRKLAQVKKGYTYFKKGDILYAKITPCMENGKVALAENLEHEIGFASTEFHILRAGKYILPRYVFLLVASKKFREKAQKKMTGSAGQKRVPRSFIENYEIPLPSITEQKKIVVQLEKLLGKIKEAKQLRAEAIIETRALLSAELHKIFEEGKKKEWEEKRIGEISIKVEYGSSQKTSDIGSVPVLRMNNIENATLNFNKLKYFPVDSTELPKLYLKKGDILFNRTNSPELVGKTAIYEGVDDEMTFASYLIRVVVDRKLTIPRYVNYVLGSSWCRNAQIVPHVTQQVGQANFSGGKLKQILIPLPSLSEQKKIVARLDLLSAKLRNLEEYQKSSSTDLDRLEQSILNSAFRI